jgi:LPXTG-motif cell wall-anchored protein
VKIIIVTALAATSVFAATVAASGAAFDISEPLSTNGPLTSPWVASGTVTPAVVDGALLLTNTDEGQRGFALYDQAISVTRGIDVTFSQAQWGGTGADGIVFFVKKGTDSSTTPGADGGAMGYAPAAAVADPPTDAIPGLSGALLGIGLDSYGNFANAGSNGTGCSTEFNGLTVPNVITVRGDGQGQVGYCLLAAPYNLSTNSLNPLSASYATRDEAARQVRVVIDPANASDPRVEVYYDGGTLPIIDIPLPASFSAVSTVKIGFSAGTGGSTNNHNVWGLTSTSAEAEEELAATGSSETVGLGALIVATLAGIAAVAVRRRRTQQ